jgi:hypothetical protein
MTDVQEKAVLPAEMQKIKLPVKQGSLVFQGRFLDTEDNDTGDRTRWAQLKAYKGFGTNEDSPDTYGREYYLLYAVGHSLVVHSPDGCRGSMVQAGRFPELNEDWEDLEPCPDCECSYSPDSHPDLQFKLEVTRYSHTQYLSAEALTDALRKCRACGHRPHDLRPSCGCGCRHYVKGDLSQIGERLLGKIAGQDPEVAMALPAEIRL